MTKFESLRSDKSKVKLWVNYLSGSCRAVAAYLLLNNIPHDVEENCSSHMRSTAASKSGEAPKLVSPFEQTPQLKFGSAQLLDETNTILRLISDAYDVKDRAMID